MYFLLPFCLLPAALALRVMNVVDARRVWHAYINNPGNATVTTRVDGHVLLHNPVGNEVGRYMVPLRGLHLSPGEFCRTSLKVPAFPGPVTLTCFMRFHDINASFHDAQTYCGGGGDCCKEPRVYVMGSKA